MNSAGLSLGLDPAHKASIEDWENMVDTNIKGLMYVTRALLPRMVERNEGSIVNLGSVAANYPYPGGNAYGATKGEGKPCLFPGLTPRRSISDHPCLFVFPSEKKRLLGSSA